MSREHLPIDLLSAHVDGETTPEERGRVEVHLAACAACRAELASIETSGQRASSVINRLVTAGQYVQFEVYNAAADTCDAQDGVTAKVHLIPLSSPQINDTPFGDARG